MLDEQERRNPYEIFKKAAEYNATILCVVPSFLRAFLMMNKESRKLPLESLLKIVLTGELLSFDLISEFYQEYTIRLINAYGQTECSGDTFHYIVPTQFAFSNHPVVPIGYPIANIEFVIIDEFGNAVNQGDEGELCIAGICLSCGYIQGDEQTNQVFKSLNALNGNMVFCTGDLVTQLEDGALVCYGRKDNQIKINGNRIEPETIEVCCMDFEGIHDALILKIETPKGGYLHLQYVSEERTEIDARELRGYLSERLPPYMMPAIITKAHDIKYSSNGKKIRNISVLTEMKADTDKIDRRSTVLTKEGMYQLILGLSRKVLRRPVEDLISMDENLIVAFSLNSLEYISLVSELENVLGIKFDLDKFIIDAFPTLNEFLDYLLEAYENRQEK